MHLLSKEISDIIHVNKTKDRTFDVVEKLKQCCTGDHHVCGCTPTSLKHFEDNPELAVKFNEVSKSSLENSYVVGEIQGDTTYYSPSPPNPSGTLPYTMKVIFHCLGSVVWTQSQCEALIDAFNVKYSGSGTIPSRWTSVAGDLGIRLEFEKLNIVSYTGADFDNVNTSPEQVHAIEDPEHFMNVWIAPLVSGYGGWASLGGIMGTSYVCTIANGLSGEFGQNTFEHEVGHLLGLDHNWGPTNAAVFGGQGHSCEDDDGVSDTPIQFGPTNEGATGACDTSIDSCPNNPGQDMWENIMDYSHTNCSNWNYSESFLTSGQGDKMRATIEAAPHADDLLGESTSGTTPPPVIQILDQSIFECVRAKGVDIQRVYISEGALLKTVISTNLEIFFTEETNTDVIERWISNVNAFSQIGEPIPSLVIGPITFTNCRITKLMFPTSHSAMESAVQRGKYSMLIEEVDEGDIFPTGMALSSSMFDNVSEEISYSVTANNQYSVTHTASVTPNERMGTSTLTPSLIAKTLIDYETPINKGLMHHYSFHDVLRSAGVVGDLSSSINKITGQASWTRSIETLDNVFLSGAGATSYPSTFEFVHNLVFDKDGIITITENGKLRLLKTADSYSGSAPDEDISYLGAELPDLITNSFTRANLIFTNYVDQPLVSERVLDVSIPEQCFINGLPVAPSLCAIKALRASPVEIVRTVNSVTQELAWSVTYSNDPQLEDDGKAIDRNIDISQASTGIVTINEKNSVIFPGAKRSLDGGATPEGVNWYLADSALANGRVNGHWTNTWDSHLNPLAINTFVFTEIRRSIGYNPEGKNFSYNVIHVSDKNLVLPQAAYDVGIKKIEIKNSDKLPQKMMREFPIPGVTMLVHNPQQSNLGSRTVSFTAYLDRNTFEQLGPPPSETQTLPLALGVRNYLALLARAELLNVFIEYPGLIFDNIFVTDCTWSISSQRTITFNASVQYVQAV